MINRSKLYMDIHDQQHEFYGSYSPPEESEHEREWRATYGAQWRNRVGLPRLVAQEVLREASGLVGSINAGIFRNEPEFDDRLREVRALLYDLYVDVSRENWRRFRPEGQ